MYIQDPSERKKTEKEKERKRKKTFRVDTLSHSIFWIGFNVC